MPNENAVENPTNSAAPSIRDLPPLETGGTEARQGIGLQDHVAAGFCILMITAADLAEVWCERHDDITLVCRRRKARKSSSSKSREMSTTSFGLLRFFAEEKKKQRTLAAPEHRSSSARLQMIAPRSRASFES